MLNNRYQITKHDSLYPACLLELENPPECLYIIGNPELLSTRSLGIIGARRCTPYGLSVAGLGGEVASRYGICVVSGGAYGCDYQAAMTCIKTGGQSILVAGCGADVVYPKSSLPLYDALKQGSGCIVSEVGWGCLPKKYLFVKRNRIIAALSHSLMVCEAGCKSGTFSTAMTAAALGKNLYAVPGNIFSELSCGTNRLIADGAAIITDKEALEMQISIDFDRAALIQETTKQANTILYMLQSGPLWIDELSESVAMSQSDCFKELVSLEAVGMVNRLIDGKYSCTYRGYLGMSKNQDLS